MVFLGIIPASSLLARFTSPKVLLPHRGLGPRGGEALAKALVVRNVRIYVYFRTLGIVDGFHELLVMICNSRAKRGFQYS